VGETGREPAPEFERLGVGPELGKTAWAAAPKARKAEEVSETGRANLAAAEAAQDPHATLHWLRVCSPALELKLVKNRNCEPARDIRLSSQAIFNLFQHHVDSSSADGVCLLQIESSGFCRIGIFRFIIGR
jgi:hypothetical protein